MGKKYCIFYFHKIFKAMWLWINYNHISTASANEKSDRVSKEIGLNIATINSSNIDHWNEVKSSILSDKVDALLISPERLANEDFIQNILEPISGNIGLFVIDEAHCISDWGHDFRPDYKRIVNILKQIPENTPILATTATANDRVIEDIKSQINGILIMRDDLKRESLSLHNIRLPHPSYRLAWLAKYIPLFKGSGIVYVLTQRCKDRFRLA